MENNKYEKLFKVYANLLPGVRDEIILVLPEIGPITWKVAYFEIQNKTVLGEEIFKKLEELKFI
jgi:hypothetical protein